MRRAATAADQVPSSLRTLAGGLGCSERLGGSVQTFRAGSGGSHSVVIRGGLSMARRFGSATVGPRAPGVFIDERGRRAMLARVFGWALGFFVLGWLILVVASLVGASWVPRTGLPGVGAVVARPPARATGLLGSHSRLLAVVEPATRSAVASGGRPGAATTNPARPATSGERPVTNPGSALVTQRVPATPAPVPTTSNPSTTTARPTDPPSTRPPVLPPTTRPHGPPTSHRHGPPGSHPGRG
ncbi:MAG: hypothetical protein JWM05_1084 [Acidimicrobiales bacterium]|nr:hypothetical protein [Acidimicrobiales bacterium]